MYVYICLYYYKVTTENPAEVASQGEEDKQEEEEEVDGDGRRRRKRKVPKRYVSMKTCRL